MAGPPPIVKTDAAAAVCVLGLWRSFDITAKSIRRFVLSPLDADAFAVIEAQTSKHTSTAEATVESTEEYMSEEYMSESTEDTDEGWSTLYFVLVLAIGVYRAV